MSDIKFSKLMHGDAAELARILDGAELHESEVRALLQNLFTKVAVMQQNISSLRDQLQGDTLP